MVHLQSELAHVAAGQCRALAAGSGTSDNYGLPRHKATLLVLMSFYAVPSCCVRGRVGESGCEQVDVHARERQRNSKRECVRACVRACARVREREGVREADSVCVWWVCMCECVHARTCPTWIVQFLSSINS